MMEKLFIDVLNLSIGAMLPILLVLAARLLLFRAPRVISYALWAVVLIRLLLPVSIALPAAVLPNTAPIPYDIGMAAIPEIDTGYRIIDNAVNASLPAATPTASANPMQLNLAIGAYLWIFGISLMLLYGILSMILLAVHVSGAEPQGDRIFICDRIASPFVLGILRPRIYVPDGLDSHELACILPHERTHIRRGDHIFKLLGFAALCVHWFNPLVWLAFVMMNRDMEISCDEAVLRQLDEESRRDYARVLLSLSTGRRYSFTPAFGEIGVKPRIRHVMGYKKPAVWITVSALLLAAIIGTVCLASAAEKTEQIAFPAGTPTRTPSNEITPFILHLDIPDHWELRAGSTDDWLAELYTGVDMFDGETYIGTVWCGGYAPYDPALYGDKPDDLSGYIFWSLTMPNMRSWNLYESLDITETSRTHLAEIYTKIQIGGNTPAAAWPVVKTLGITCYDDTKHVYAAIEFAENAVTPELQRKIAESLRIE